MGGGDPNEEEFNAAARAAEREGRDDMTPAGFGFASLHNRQENDDDMVSERSREEARRESLLKSAVSSALGTRENLTNDGTNTPPVVRQVQFAQ